MTISGATDTQSPLPGGRTPLSALAGTPWDVLVIGGGITGTGIARDAAMRGLRTALVEARDLGAGTSSHSSRLVHGGLRYLEQYEFGLVRESCHERRVLLDIAPHLVRPLAFAFPVHRGARVPRWQLAAGMWLYDALALFRNVKRHRMLGKRGFLREEPMLRERELTGGAIYWDAQCDDARLVVATARAAIVHGAAVATYARVESLEWQDGRVAGAHLVDTLDGTRALVRARVVVNATGPWTDQLRAMEEPGVEPLLRPTKGVHAVVARERIGHRHAITMTSPVDGRVMFVLPWGPHLSYIGTTDTDSATPPGSERATEEDVVYLLRSVNAMFPSARLTEADVRATWAGLRPLLAPADGVTESERSREHVIIEGRGGMLTIAGGKLTTYRVMARELVDRAAAVLAERDGSPRAPAPPTDLTALPGGEARDLEPFRRQGLELGLSEATVDHLLSHFGGEAAAVFNLAREAPVLARPIHPDHPAIAAEVIHVGRRELARTVEDVLRRRLHLTWETLDRGAGAALPVAELLGQELGWSEAEVATAAEAYVAPPVISREAPPAG